MDWLSNQVDDMLGFERDKRLLMATLDGTIEIKVCPECAGPVNVAPK